LRNDRIEFVSLTRNHVVLVSAGHQSDQSFRQIMSDGVSSIRRLMVDGDGGGR